MKREIFLEKRSHFCADCAIMERVCRKDVRKCQNRAMPPTHGLKGYNCSQSVVAAFAPQLGLTEETALRLSAGFGAGIGRMREVCGAFCGVVTVLSMVYADPTDPKDKSRMYALVQQAAEQYRSRNGGSIICRELLAKAGAAPTGGTAAEERTAEDYKKRP